MATDFTERTAADAVVASFQNTPDPRLRQVMTSLVGHLHEFVRDVRPSTAEWQAAIDFLTATGHSCDDTRQEFILLSDVLGVSMLVETINGDVCEDATASTVLGPFHLVESPQRRLGENICETSAGTPCVVSGRVLSTTGESLPGARIDVWQASPDGFYDVQQPDVQPVGNGRGLFTADEEGGFWFRTVVPSHYPIPTDGPVGQLLTSTTRHPYRPAHIHVIGTAERHRPVTTHIFVADSPYLESDAVFAVKNSLIRDFEWCDDAAEAAKLGVPAPFRRAHVDIVLQA